MKKVVEVVMFDKNDNKIMTKVFDTKTVKGLAQIKRINELEYDGDAQVKLNAAITDVCSHCTIIDINYIIIYNDYSDTIDKINID